MAKNLLECSACEAHFDPSKAVWKKITDQEKEKAGKQLEIELKARGVKSLDELSEHEQAEVATEVMLKSGIGPKALKGFDAVKAVREGRG